MRFRASDVAAATSGRLVGPDVDLDGASFDSRTIGAGQLFVPIVAERDGHDFVAAAVSAGAAAFLTSRPAGTWATLPATAIEVSDTADALLLLATWARGRLTDRVVGITGSVGKTSTKDLVVGALRATLNVSASERSFNNDQGLPVSLLAAADDAQAIVLEMGMRGFGEIARLCRVARPTIGIVTAVGESHTARVGGIEGVAIAKRELVDALPAEGTAVLNADDERVLAMRSASAADVITFGSSAAADVRVAALELDATARPRFVAETPWGHVEVALAVSGAHMAINAAAALATAGVLGVPLDAAAAALGAATIAEMRMQTHRTASGALVINDAYNANPTSMRAAIESLAALPARRKVAVLGVMAEIDDEAAAHERIAALVGGAGIELVAVGTDLYGVAPTSDPVAAVGSLGPDCAVLVKASRVAALEGIARQLA